MPPFACSIRPIRRFAAPVKAPTSWPKSSLSSTLSGSAPQFSATKLPRRPLQRCSRLATTSLPDPVSPRTSTSTAASATCRIVSRSRTIDSVSPTSDMSSPTPAAASRSRRFSSTSRRFSAARATVPASRAASNGLAMKS